MRSALVALAIVLVAASAARAQQCPAGQMLCPSGQFCAPSGYTCCDAVGHPDKSCGPTFACTADGSCTTTCNPGSMSTIASCGDDSCGCSSPCKKHGDCESTCCTTAGFCAPLCVCEGGKLFLGCDGTSPGVGGLPAPKSCQLAPGDASLAALALVAMMLFSLHRRRRSI